MLADLFLKELAKFGDKPEAADAGLVFLGRELAKRYKEQQETLAAIATEFVRASHELAELRR